MQRLATSFEHLLGQRGHLFPWVPVFLSFGIGLYFSLPKEPSGLMLTGVAVLAAVCLWLSLLSRSGVRLCGIGAALVFLGVLLASLKAHSVSEPVLGYRYYGAVEGRVVALDRSLSDKTRVTLDQVRMDRIAPQDTPKRVRISLHGDQSFITLKPGLRVAVTAHLSPPQGPAEPGGFNFQRFAWFKQLGAVGYTRSPMLALEAAHPHRLYIFKIRRALSLAMQRQMPGETGAFAAAIVTGDRSAMGQETLKALRASNLAHLLAISGLHMGLLTGFVFALMRYGLALIPAIALRFSTKKMAACVALFAAAIYLALSGGNVATQRAFVMVAVMLLAVLLDRRALTLRAVALAAVIILVLRPEALTQPGFQMSFAATTALIAVFSALKHVEGWNRGLPKWAKPVATLIISSGVAGLATAPIAAAHFNQIAQYGLLANILTVPVMVAIVMPAAVLAALLYPIGLAVIPLFFMEKAIAWIMLVAHWVTGFENATTKVPTPPTSVLVTICLGALIVMLWQGRGRMVGIPVAVIGFAIWGMATRPDILISADGRLMGVMTEDGRALNKPKGQGFVARSWLENDGDKVEQGTAYARIGILSSDLGTIISKPGGSVILLKKEQPAAVIADLCQRHGVIIARKKAEAQPGCLIYDARTLARSGSIAITTRGQGFHISTAAERAGERLWTNRPTQRRARFSQ